MILLRKNKQVIHNTLACLRGIKRAKDQCINNNTNFNKGAATLPTLNVAMFEAHPPRHSGPSDLWLHGRWPCFGILRLKYFMFKT